MTKEIEIRKPLFIREEFLKLKTKQEKEEYLRGANLIRADLSSLNLSFLNFIGLDLSHADLRYANLRGSDLREADLRDADLRDADKRADLRYAYLPKHKFATISGYQIFIFESHIQVGCYFFTHEQFLQDKAEELTAWKESEKKFFRQNKEEIIKLVQEFNLNKGD